MESEFKATVSWDMSCKENVHKVNTILKQIKWSMCIVSDSCNMKREVRDK